MKYHKCPIWFKSGQPWSSSLVIARRVSNEINLSAHNMHCFRYYITKRYKRRTTWLLRCYLLSHSTMLRFLYLWAWPWCVNRALWKKEEGLVWRSFLVLMLVFWSCLICGVPLNRLVCVNKNWAHLSERNVPKLKSGKTYEAIAKEMLRYIHC